MTVPHLTKPGAPAPERDWLGIALLIAVLTVMAALTAVIVCGTVL